MGSACADRHRLSLLTGISVLLATEPVFPVVVMLVGPAAQQDGWLVTHLHALGDHATEIRRVLVNGSAGLWPARRRVQIVYDVCESYPAREAAGQPRLGCRPSETSRLEG